MTRRNIFTYVFVFFLSLSAPISFAQGFSPQGVFGCNQTGSYSMSVGSLGALGGTFVPVNDAAVTLNTGYLVYKECVLRAIANRERENAVATIVAEGVKTFLTGRRTLDELGNVVTGPYFPTNIQLDKVRLADQVVQAALSGNRLNMLYPVFQNDIKTAIARSYAMQTRNSGGSIGCSFTGSAQDFMALQQGQGTGGAYDVLLLTDPNCNPLFAYMNAQSLVERDVSTSLDEMMTRLGWSRGVYDVTDASGNIITPGFILAGTIEQLLGSGFRQQESANDIDQMIGSMFANIGNQLISAGVGGLQGLINSAVGRPSYLSQIVTTSEEGLRTSAANAGIQILAAARAVEQSYLDAQNEMAQALVGEIARLRSAEAQCWNLVIPKVKEYASAGNCTTSISGTVTCTGTFTMRIATSTAFSQAVINANIAPTANATAQNINNSDQALDTLDTLITNVSNSNTPDAQATALQQVDLLVSQKILHTQYDQKAAEEQIRSTLTGINTLVTDTIRAWGDSTDPNVGWCNTNNPAVIKMWADRWKV